MTQQPHINGSDPTGTFKRFGEFGPAYQVTSHAKTNEKGQQVLPIVVLESGEKLDYTYQQFLADPRAD